MTRSSERRGTDAPSRLLADAVMTLSEEARWEAHDLVARRDVAEAVALLRGHSGELALSLSASDVLFGLALDQAAAALADGAAIPRVDLSAYLIPRPLPETTLARIRAQSAALAGQAAEAVGALRREATDRGQGRRSRVRARGAALALRQKAALNRLCWADARLALGEGERALMLAAADVFDRAAQAAAPRPWWRRLVGHRP